MIKTSFPRFGRRLFAGLAVVAVASALGGQAKAETVYAYAQQSVTGVSVTATSGGLTVGPVSLSGTTSATIVDGPNSGSSGSLVNTADALQAYQGAAGTAPVQNFFGQKGSVDADYARADSLIGATDVVTGVAGSTVAETYLSTPTGAAGSDLGQGNGSWTLGANITLANATTLDFSATYANLIEIISAGALNSASAEYSFTVTIRQGNTTVFSWSPTALNNLQTIDGSGTISLSDSGTATITTASLAAGSYRLSISNTSSVNATVVPEPSSWVMLSMGVVGLMGYGWRRRRLASLSAA